MKHPTERPAHNSLGTEGEEEILQHLSLKGLVGKVSSTVKSFKTRPRLKSKASHAPGASSLRLEILRVPFSVTFLQVK